MYNLSRKPIKIENANEVVDKKYFYNSVNLCYDFTVVLHDVRLF